jgi:hypothetical protein
MFYAELCLVKCIYKYADVEVEGRCVQILDSSMHNFTRDLEDCLLFLIQHFIQLFRSVFCLMHGSSSLAGTTLTGATPWADIWHSASKPNMATSKRHNVH